MRRVAVVWQAMVVLGALAAMRPAEARVVRFVVENRRPFAEGMLFGDVGAYERLDGTAYFEVAPLDPLHAQIVHLGEAPRNERGMVEFRSPFFILKPVEMRKGNGKIFYVINNRGNKQALGYFNYSSAGNDPISVEDAGDGYLMRLGYTIVDAGWQGDVAPGNNRLSPAFPTIDGLGAYIRIEYSDRTIPAAGTYSLPLEGDPSFVSYETDDTDPSHYTLTVRDDVDAPKIPIASDRWAFGTCPDGKTLTPSNRDICYFDRFQPDRLYELIYWAVNPKVMGLAYAVTRDVGSFLRFETHDEEGRRNPLALSDDEVGITRSYSFGGSSTGMYQREFLYLGFNEDESHRKVFDAAWIHKPGTHRLFANVQFADPNTYSREDDRHDFLSTSYPPLTFQVRTDELSGITDGILKRAGIDPLVFQTDTEQEYYQFRASLYLTNSLGEPIEVPENVRVYLLSGFQHGGNSPPTVFPGPRGMCEQPTNPNYHGPTVRALLLALDAWADQGIEPPPNAVPDVRDGTLVSLDDARAAFPPIPGVQFPPFLNELELLDFGSNFYPWGGWLTDIPPTRGPRYNVLVPKPDADGIDIAGIRPMETRAPLGTNTGWNVRAPGFRSPHLCSLSGSYIPFAATRAEREQSGDPRRSLEERYGDHDGYVESVRNAARELREAGFLIEEDEARFISEAQASNVLRSRGLVNQRVVPTDSSSTLQLDSGDTVPHDGADNVPVDTLLRIGFDNPPQLGGAGRIQIWRASDQALVDEIALEDPYAIYDGSVGKLTEHLSSSKVNVIGGLRTGIDMVRVLNYVPVVVDGTTATIYPHNNRLTYGTQYYVTIDEGVLQGTVAGELFIGVAPNQWTFSTKASAPNGYAVASDNSGDFATVQGAIDAVPPGNRSPVVIDIAPGIYQELLFVRDKYDVTLRSADSVATVIQYENCDGFNPGTGATQPVINPGEGGTLPEGPLNGGGRAVLLTSNADLLTLDNITLKNTHAQGSTTLRDGTPLDQEGLTYVNYRSAITQAETIYFNTGFTSSSPAARLVAKHSNFVSYQDTIQVKGWSWFYDSFVTGDVDFIWGNANAALFERCEIKSRFRPDVGYVMQSRAYLGYGPDSTPADYNRSYPGFVFLDSALTKEEGSFTSYLARSPGSPAVTGNPGEYYYYNYDIVAYLNTSMDNHIPSVGWAPPGPNVDGTAVTGWREHRSVTPENRPVDVTNRLSRSSDPPSTTGHDSIQLSRADVATFFADRGTIFSGATNGTMATLGYPGGWNPQP